MQFIFDYVGVIKGHKQFQVTCIFCMNHFSFYFKNGHRIYVIQKRRFVCMYFTMGSIVKCMSFTKIIHNLKRVFNYIFNNFTWILQQRSQQQLLLRQLWTNKNEKKTIVVKAMCEQKKTQNQNSPPPPTKRKKNRKKPQNMFYTIYKIHVLENLGCVKFKIILLTRNELVARQRLGLLFVT